MATTKQSDTPDYSGYQIVRIREWEHSLAETLFKAVDDEYDRISRNLDMFPLSVENVTVADENPHELALIAGTCDVVLDGHTIPEQRYEDCHFEINRGGNDDEIIVGEVEVILEL